MLSEDQIERYSRQIILPQVGGKGQEKLLQARVLVNGNGLLQGEALFYLAAVGIGTVGIIADDLFPVFSSLAPNGTDPSSWVLRHLNPDCTVTRHATREVALPEELKQLVHEYDLVLSEPDNRLHEACYARRRPFLCATITSTCGWLLICQGYEANLPCLYCVSPPSGEERSDPCLENLIAAFLGTVQTTEAIKLILDLHRSGSNNLLQCQFPGLHFQQSVAGKNPHCSFCGRSAC